MQACGFRSITEPLLQNLDRRKLVLRPGTHFYTGDKRDNMSAYASYQRLSRLPSGARYPLAAVGPGFPVMWRLLSCQNFSIKRTPERTLLTP